MMGIAIMADKHTPGPWRENYGTVLDENLNLIAVVHSGVWPDEKCRADTRLIAAAPELLALLEEARRTLEMWKDVAPAVSLCADIDKMIAKARGEK